jgi:hypothetical protein
MGLSLPSLKGLPGCGTFSAKTRKVLGKLPCLVTLLYRDISLMACLPVDVSYFNNFHLTIKVSIIK